MAVVAEAAHALALEALVAMMAVVAVAAFAVALEALR